MRIRIIENSEGKMIWEGLQAAVPRYDETIVLPGSDGDDMEYKVLYVTWYPHQSYSRAEIMVELT